MLDLSLIEKPTVLLDETRAQLIANPHITFVETSHGGHCAYLSNDPGNEIHWAEATVIRFLMQT